MDLFGKKASKKKQRELVRTIKNSDRGKRQAREQLKAMMESDDPTVLDEIARARVRIYSQAAYEGDEQAQYRLGISQAKLGNKEVSLEWLTGLAKKGDVRAMKAIARGYAPNGIYGGSRQEYRHWTQKAAEAGDAQAQADLGRFHAGKDEKQSRYWYKQSAMQGCPAGCIGLGKACYNEALQSFGKEEAKRRRKMLERAEKCFLQAAELSQRDEDFAEACHELGSLYETMANGKEGGADSAERAAFFFCQAWNRGKQEADQAAFDRVRERFRLKADPLNMEKWEKELFGTEKKPLEKEKEPFGTEKEPLEKEKESLEKEAVIQE